MSATDDQEKCRFDFEFVGVDDDQHMVYAAPHSRRYERVIRDGEPFLLDKYFNTLVSFREITKDIASLPTFQSPRTINSAPSYAQSRE